MPDKLTYATYPHMTLPCFGGGVQIIDYNSGDALLIKISNIFGDDYDEFVMFEPVLFEALEITV